MCTRLTFEKPPSDGSLVAMRRFACSCICGVWLPMAYRPFITVR